MLPFLILMWVLKGSKGRNIRLLNNDMVGIIELFLFFFFFFGALNYVIEAIYRNTYPAIQCLYIVAHYTVTDSIKDVVRQLIRVMQIMLTVVYRKSIVESIESGSNVLILLLAMKREGIKGKQEQV